MTAVGTSSCKSPSRLEPMSVVSKVTPVTLPPGWFKLATRPSLTGSSAEATMGMRALAALAASAGADPPGRNDDGDRAPDQISRQGRQPIGFVPRPSGIRSRRSGPRRSPLPSDLGGKQSKNA